MEAKRIIMNFSSPPSAEDIEVIATGVLETLPEELLTVCEELSVSVEEFPDTALEQELDLEDPYELLALYRSGNQISPGVECKAKDAEGVLVLFRRPILDMWCESAEDLGVTIRAVMIEELGRSLEFPEQEIDDMVARHYQGMF